VFTSDPFACGRNYFSRPLAPEQESLEEVEERARIFEEIGQSKKLAIDYLQPERRVKSTTWNARNYFDRASAPGHAGHTTSSGHAIFHAHGIIHQHLRDHVVVQDRKSDSRHSSDPSCVLHFGPDDLM
jgi:hypothetical protein